MAKQKDPVEKSHVKRERKPDPGLDTCPECGGVVVKTGTVLLAASTGEIHDCVVWFIMRGARWGRPRLQKEFS